MRDKLNKIRAETDTIITTKQRLLRILFVFIFGLALGFFAKYADTIPSNGINGTWLLSIIGDIGTCLGIWVFISAIIAAWSRSSKAAAINVFFFFVGMLISYYTYSWVLFGFFPKRYFLAWGMMALLSPIYAYIVWHSRGNSWIAAFCAAIPISMLFLEGYTFYYTYSIEQGFDLFFAILLFVFLPKENLQRLRLIPFVAAMFFIMWRIELMSFIFGRI